MKKKYGRQRMTLRTAQKPSLRYAVAAGSVLAIAAVLFIYINFSNNTESRAVQSASPSYKVTYSTTDAVVPVRLLLKPHPAIKESTKEHNAKSDASYKPVRTGRSIKIEDERYVSE